MKKRKLYTITPKRPAEKWPHRGYDAFCELCDYTSRAWDWRRNALAHIHMHLLTEHHTLPGVTIHTMGDGYYDVMQVMVFGLRGDRAPVARELARHYLLIERGWDDDDSRLELLDAPPRSFTGNIVPLQPDSDFGWLWIETPNGRAHAIGWDLQ